MKQREIKFRALNMNNDWCFGHYFYNEIKETHRILSYFKPSSNKDSWTVFKDDIRIETLGQFTGFISRNDKKEVYKGDKIHCYNHDVNEHFEGVVIFQSGCFVLDMGDGGWDYINKEYITNVIGNIYEDPNY